MPIWILCRSPLDGSTLRGNHDDFGILFQQLPVEQGSRDSQRPNGANVNRFDLFCKVESIDRFELFVEITGVVDELQGETKTNMHE
jgi:hypothetical protein